MLPTPIKAYVDSLPGGIRGWCLETSKSGNKVVMRVKAEGHAYVEATITSSRLEDATALYDEALDYYRSRDT